jgi:hypothetical protein
LVGVRVAGNDPYVDPGCRPLARSAGPRRREHYRTFLHERVVDVTMPNRVHHDRVKPEAVRGQLQARVGQEPTLQVAKEAVTVLHRPLPDGTSFESVSIASLWCRKLGHAADLRIRRRQLEFTGPVNRQLASLQMTRIWPERPTQRCKDGDEFPHPQNIGTRKPRRGRTSLPSAESPSFDFPPIGVKVGVAGSTRAGCSGPWHSRLRRDEP